MRSNSFGGERPAIIIADASSGAIDAMALVRQVRADPELGATPLLLIGDRRESVLMMQAVQAGATDFLLKPIQAHKLSRRLQELLGAL